MRLDWTTWPFARDFREQGAGQTTIDGVFELLCDGSAIKTAVNGYDDSMHVGLDIDKLDFCDLS